MGIQPHYLEDSISLVIAQRLIRTLCPVCKTPDPENAGVYRAAGCHACQDGYKGRTGVFECSTAGAIDYSTLWESAGVKVAAGITTHAEMSRVIAKTQLRVG